MSQTLLPVRPSGAFSPQAFRRPATGPSPDHAAARRAAAQQMHPARSSDAPARADDDPPREPLAADVLSVIAAGLADSVTYEELAEPVPGERTYTRLLATDRYDAWLIAWSPSGALELHDHGGSRRAVHLARGRLSETFTDRDRPRPVRTRTFGEGADFVVPTDRIHEVWNPGAQTAWSVHVYSPPLTSMTFYDQDSGGALTPIRTDHGDLAELESATAP